MSKVIEFPTQYQKRSFPSVSGSRFEPIYSASYDADGVLQLEQVGEKDVYDEIQSYKDSVDINVILQRFQLGDSKVLEKVQGFYEDVSDMPKTYQDVLNSVIESEQFFDSLPVDVKNRFNNSFSEFMVSLGKPDFMDNFKDSKSDVVSSDGDDASVEGDDVE